MYYHIFHIHSSVDQHLGCFQYSHIMFFRLFPPFRVLHYCVFHKCPCLQLYLTGRSREKWISDTLSYLLDSSNTEKDCLGVYLGKEWCGSQKIKTLSSCHLFSQFQSLNFLLKLKLRKIVAKFSDIITVSGKTNVTESENI